MYVTSDGYLTVSSTLDYESLTNTSYILNITATDGKNTATATISLIVTDQNEAPVFQQIQYSVEVNESAVRILLKLNDKTYVHKQKKSIV